MHCIFSVRKLQSWWRSCSAKNKMQTALELWRVKRTRRFIDCWRVDIQFAKADLAEVKHDIKFHRKNLRRDRRRVTELRTWREDQKERIPFVECELAEATVKDVEEGWVAAFTEELQYGAEFLEMIKEDLLATRIRMVERRDALQMFELEVDELEGEIDEVRLKLVSLVDCLV